MANNTTKIIKFRAQFEETKGFGKWLQDIEKNIDMSVDNSFTKWIKSYKTRLEALEKTMKDVGDSPSDNVMSSMHKEMKGMLEISRKIANEFSKMSLGGASKQLEAAAKAVQDASRAKKNASSNKRNWENKKSVDGQTLSDNELKRIFDKNSAKGFDFNGIKFGGDNGAGLAEFIEEVKKNIELLKKAEDGIAKTIQDRFNQVEAEVEKYGDEAAQAAKDLEEARINFAKAAASVVSGDGADTSGLAVEGQERVNKMSIASDEASDAIKAHEDETKAKVNATLATADYNKETAKTPNVVAKAAKQVFAYGAVVSLFKKLISGARKTIIELDAAFTDMAVVTNLTRKEAWGMVDDFQKVAKETGAVTSEVAATITKFLQQGKSLSQATQLSEAALKAAKIAGIDTARSVDLLTNAMNGFQMSASQALEVSDKFAALAASSATSYEELAVALSKVAAQANLAGMSMDFTLGMLAKGIEVTREAPETIGTALKTVISRMRELNDYGETLEEGMDVNRVETALENVGVKLRDTNGQFRNLEDVLTELGGKWNELNINQQANVAIALAGTRQQSRLIAMMQDFDRTLELVDISTNSYSATMAQHMEYMESMKAATDGLKTSYEGLVKKLVPSDALIGIVNILTRVVEVVDYILNDMHALVPVMVIMSTLGLNVLSNKIQEHQYAKMSLKIQQTEAQIQRQQWLEKNAHLAKEAIAQGEKQVAQAQEKLHNKQIAADDAKKIINEKQQLLLEKQQTKEKKKQSVLEDTSLSDAAKQNKLAAIEAEYTQEEASIKEEIRVASEAQSAAQEEVIAAQLELQAAQEFYKKATNASEAEKLQYMQKQSLEATTQLNSFGMIGSLVNGLLVPFQMVASIMTTINTLSALFLSLQKKEGQETDKNTRKTIKNAAAKKLSAAFGMAGSAAAIPVAGWAIGAAILLAVLGLAIAGIANTSKAQEKSTDTVEGNVKAMQKLQAEIYNLSNTLNSVSTLSDEFETLSSKINKTAEDTQRLKEIITEFNDSAGYKVIETTASYAEAMKAMLAYEAFIEAEVQEKMRKSNENLALFIRNADTLSAYLNDVNGRLTIQQNLAQNYNKFGNANDTTQSIILDALAKQPSQFIGKNGGLDYSKIQEGFSESDIEAIDAAIISGSVREYKNALNELGDAAKNYVKISDTLFQHVNKWSDIVVTSVDNLGLSADQLAKLSPFLLANEDNIQKWIEENDGEALTKAQLLTKLYENRDAGLAAVNSKQAQDDLDAYLNSAEYAHFKTLQDQVAEAGGLTEANLGASDEKTYLAGIEKLSQLKEEVKETAEAEKIANMSTQEWWNTFGNAPSLTVLQDGIDKATSSIEKFSKFAAGSLDSADMDELLTKYPTLVDYISDGVVTATELNEVRQEIFNQQLKELEAALEIIEAGNSQLIEKSLAGTDITWEQIKDMDADGVKELLNGLTNVDQATKDAVMESWRNYQKNRIKTEEFANTFGMTPAELKKIGESTGLTLAEAQYNAYKKKLDLYSEDDPAYAQLLGQSMNVASIAIQEAKKDKDDLHKQIQQRLGNYDFEIIDGSIYYKNEQGLLQSLDSLEGATKVAFSDVSENMSDILQEYSKTAETEQQYAENIANEYVEMRKKQLEEDKEILEKRKEAYEKYFDQLDAMEEQQERSQNKEDIIKQIAALSTGMDSTSRQKVDTLKQQLKDLQKEETQAYKEELRNNLLEDIDDQAKKLDEHMQDLDDSVGLLIRTLMANATGSAFEFKENAGTLTEQLDIWLKNLGIPGFANGGMVNYTGLAMVHGSPEAPESFLDAEDTKLLSSILEGLYLNINQIQDNNDGNIHNTEHITIGNITIQTAQLNNTQDFKDAGSELAREFGKIIKERGININVKK